MSKKFVLIPMSTFTELCSTTKRNGTTIEGTVKNLSEVKDETKKRTANKSIQR